MIDRRYQVQYNRSSMTVKIVIRPDVNAYYCSYYIKGLVDLFGEDSISFSAGGFPRTRQLHSMLLRTGENGPKVMIDTRDTSELYQDALEWCDVYAKVNPSLGDYGFEGSDKVLAIGPSFGIRIWGLPRALLLGTGNCWKSRSLLKGRGDFREHFADYWRQYHYRLPLHAYGPSRSRDDYIFSISSFWHHDPACNSMRAAFIKACLDHPGVEFEGGFAPRGPGVMGDLEPLSTARRYPLTEYVEKLQRSAVAFNTPAVDGCLGWKLAEYLALGKAIISTPLERRMPAPLEHGTHVHFVDGSPGSIDEALGLMLERKDYRENLERNARDYFFEHLAPERCIGRIFRTP
jgi:hypothetical protein